MSIRFSVAEKTSNFLYASASVHLNQLSLIIITTDKLKVEGKIGSGMRTVYSITLNSHLRLSSK